MICPICKSKKATISHCVSSIEVDNNPVLKVYAYFFVCINCNKKLNKWIDSGKIVNYEINYQKEGIVDVGVTYSDPIEGF